MSDDKVSTATDSFGPNHGPAVTSPKDAETTAAPDPARAGRSFWRRLADLATPGYLTGVTLPTWLRLLRDHHFDIDHPYWLRAAVVTLGSVPNWAFAALERLAYGRAASRAVVHPPLFVLGLARSGTTHLHNMLARDGRLAWPNFYQMLYPGSFLLCERFHAPLVGLFMDEKRPMDNVRFGVGEPQEDEWGLASLVGRSWLLASAFPRQSALHARYLTLRDLGDGERARWKAALLLLVRKLSYKYGRPVVLKSPGHTGRVRTLLELFPDARFVHIRRNPYTVFQSALHLHQKTSAQTTYQRGEEFDPVSAVLRFNRELTDAFFEDRRLVPPGRLHELNFEDLERDPVGQVRLTYEALGLPDFAAFEPALRAYLQSLGEYRKNRHRELPPQQKQRVAAEWGRLFDEWGYER